MPGVSQIHTLDSLLTGGTTLTVVTATVLVALTVIVPRLRRRVSLPAAVLALLGAIAARFTQTTTAFGDEIFRGSTVFWSLGLAMVCVLWWLAADRGEQRRLHAGGAASPAESGAGEVVIDYASPTGRGRTDHHDPHGGGTTALLERPATEATAHRFSPALVVIGGSALVVAVCTFLTATGIHPIGLGLLTAAP